MARAVRTKSEASTASIEARVMRAIGASEKMPRVKAGRMSWLNAPRKASKFARQQTVEGEEAGDLRRRG